MQRADYHFHTDHSYDSRITPEAALEGALKAKLDLLCVTDHDTIAGAIRLKEMSCPGVRIVVGCEFTAEDGSHIIGLNLKNMITEKGILTILEKIKLQGGLVLLPHLFRRGSGIFRSEMKRTDEFVTRVLSYADMVECFNGKDIYEHNQKSYRFAVEHGLPAVAGSDAHAPADIGTVFVEYDEASFVHGVSPRRVVFPVQVPTTENPLKRRVLELYHLHQRRFPPIVRRAYRALKARLATAPARAVEASPRAHYTFPLAASHPVHGNGGPFR